MTDGKAFPGRRGVGQAAGASVGFRGAALNQSRSASGVYTGLVCYGEMEIRGSASCGKGENTAAGRKCKMQVTMK
ncbi:hypothetical protein DN744_12645 [Klebsiella pneumoniae subsp. pneumoniae]|nr:hypothetical protein A6D82_029970 [Klebsiella pneumoniae]KAE8570477.1 hypothetical protein DN744_12645 [Klebsiella pneumoniae subsp. pneumoniae]HAJ2753342.1 hypothetical protein [Escherichia coli]HBP6762827.1 hypothetical protein [Pseudomonas aeruginosa]MDI4444113.1 hypothetical protein [Klebsiella pneumoniae]